MPSFVYASERRQGQGVGRPLWTSGRSTRGAIRHACLRRRLRWSACATPALAQVVQRERLAGVGKDRRFHGEDGVCAESA